MCSHVLPSGMPAVARVGLDKSGTKSSTPLWVAATPSLELSPAGTRGLCWQEAQVRSQSQAAKAITVHTRHGSMS